MSRILAFDTSGPYCAVALMIDGTVVAKRHEEMSRGQSERLFPMIDEVMGDIGAVFEELDGIGVGIGPGNFTGLRIGVSAARGLSLSLGVPAIGVSAFDLVGPTDHGTCVVSLPTSRKGMDVMVQVYGDGEPQGDPIEAPVFKRDDNPDRNPLLDIVLEQGDAIIGANAPALHWILAERHGNFCTYDEVVVTDPASVIATRAMTRLHEPDAHPRPSPIYIRPADAAPASDIPPPLIG